MLKLINVKMLSQACEALFYPYPATYQSVRWARKPLWYPTAKTKLFRISPRIRLPEDEREELKRLNNNYRTQVKSLNEYFKEKYSEENMQQFDVEQHRKAAEEDFARCNELNNQWNKEIQLSREERINKELEDSIIDAKQRLEQRLKIHAEWLEKAEEIVRKEKVASEHFITPDQLDAAIEYAINNPVDYNYALNTDGSKIRGRETLPPEKIGSTEKISVKQ